MRSGSLEMWEEIQFEDPDALAHPQPRRSCTGTFGQLRHSEWESSDESEDGFWDPRPDWLERAERRLEHKD